MASFSSKMENGIQGTFGIRTLGEGKPLPLPDGHCCVCLSRSRRMLFSCDECRCKGCCVRLSQGESAEPGMRCKMRSAPWSRRVNLRNAPFGVIRSVMSSCCPHLLHPALRCSRLHGQYSPIQAAHHGKKAANIIVRSFSAESAVPGSAPQRRAARSPSPSARRTGCGSPFPSHPTHHR